MVIAVAMLCALSACVQQMGSIEQRGTAMRRPAGEARIVLMPPDIELSELEAGGQLTPRADWTQAAKRHMVELLKEEVGARRGRASQFDDTGLRSAEQGQVNQVIKLSNAVGSAVRLHTLTFESLKLPTRQHPTEWSLGPAVRSLRESTGADYALFLHARDSFATAGRVALMMTAAVFRVSVPLGQQYAFATLVDLDTGNIVWFNATRSISGDLRESTSAKETVGVLLRGLPQ